MFVHHSPDKLPNDPGAHKRFERLGLINKILRDHRKDRYDHFLSTGFPKWRGTGYYYQRFRPGLFSVLLIILGISVGVELLIKRVQFEQAKKRVAGLRKWSFYSAYGPRFWEVVYKRENGPKVPSEKKVKVSLGSVVDLPSPASSSSSKDQGQLPAAGFDWEALEREVKRSAQQSTPSGGPSGSVEVLVTLEDDGEAIVWITDAETGEWVEVDETKLPKPTLKECWPVRVAHKVRGKRGAEIVLEQEGETAPTDASGAATAAAATTSATKTASANGNAKQRKNKKR